MLSLIFFLGCSQSSNTAKTENPSPEKDGIVSISALISSGGLSISSKDPDIISNQIDLGISLTQQSVLEKIITIKNDSENDISVSVSSLTENGFKIITNRCPEILSVKRNCQLNVRFYPRGLYNGEYQDQLSINSDPNLSVVLKAQIENNPIPTVGPVNLQVDFSPYNALPFSKLPTRNKITFKNNSSDKIAPPASLIPLLSGNGANSYSIWLNRCGSPLKPNHSCEITLTSKRINESITKFPEVSMTIGSSGVFRLACNSGESYNPTLDLCEDITAPIVPSLNLITQYPSNEAILKFSPSSCDTLSHIAYSENNVEPIESDSSWQVCSASTEYTHDLSTLYTSGNHFRTIYYWVRKESNNMVSQGSFTVEYYPEELFITNILPDNKLHISQSWNFTSQGGVPSLFFTFGNDTQEHNGATISNSGEFVPSESAVGTIEVKLTDSNLPANVSKSYNFNLFSCQPNESFNLSLNNCYANEVSCTGDIPNSTSAIRTWNNTTGAYGNCTLQTCRGGYYKSGNSCIAMDSCKTYLSYYPSSRNVNGMYQLADTASGTQFNAYCDMTTGDGGWTLLFSPDATTAWNVNVGVGYASNHAIYQGTDSRAVSKTVFGHSTTLAEQQKAVRFVKFTQLNLGGYGLTSTVANTTWVQKFNARTPWNFTTYVNGLWTCTNSTYNKWDMIYNGTHTQAQGILACHTGGCANGDCEFRAIGARSARRTHYSCGTGGDGGSSGGDTAGMQYYCSTWYLLANPSHRGGNSVMSNTGDKNHMIWGR